MTLPITVGIDGSSSAERALGWAAAEAVLRHTPLDIVHVNPPITVPPEIPAATAMSAAIATQSRRWLNDAVDIVEAVAPEVPVTAELIEDQVLDALTRRSSHAQLLVLGSRGIGGFAQLLVGSVAIALAAHARCPVAVVRGAVPGPTAPIVVGIDGSPTSDAALAFAVDEASLRSAPLVAYHAWRDTVHEPGGQHQPFVLDWNAIRDAEEKVLAQRLGGWQDRYPDVEIRHVVERDRPAQGLLRQSARAQLVVVGSRGRGGLTGMLLGSTSHALIHHGACPVVVAR
ncbi:universal stress protein [Kutzneria kofuensis]|uniref:Nucleotide-binding universal stress UspA family protein n=1 Tax=Kutzneria kofuensis TaxID=103725 RepID=A0A7W9KQE5_9PSEU|nr:universal stress protein [Kutzneria kofuensis]MBB5896727.1 nucleotide-binding universal stress UspA family protein [Kutzneria kofuensis]